MMQEQDGKDKNHWYPRIFLVRKGALLSLLKEFKVDLTSRQFNDICTCHTYGLLPANVFFISR